MLPIRDQAVNMMKLKPFHIIVAPINEDFTERDYGARKLTVNYKLLLSISSIVNLSRWVVKTSITHFVKKCSWRYLTPLITDLR